MPLVRRLRSWLASTTNVLASVPFVMYSLLPLSRYWPFDRVAVVRIAPESLPDPGSVRANAPSSWPLASGGRNWFF